MILYYTGTGNSRYAALKIAESIGDEAIDLFEKLRTGDVSPLCSDKPWVIVTPTYAWRIPRIVKQWLDNAELQGSRDMYFVMTCGSEIGNAASYIEKWCAEKGFAFMGCAEVVMPENYIAMFDAPDKKEEAEIIVRANGSISSAAKVISENGHIPPKPVGLLDRIYSSAVNKVFYPMFVHAKKFYTTDACIGCGKCVSLCPTNNIRIENGKPIWEDNCTHCMACICRCPTEAVEYGNIAKGKRRYYRD